MNQTMVQENKTQYDCRTYRCDAIAEILGIGRSAAYALLREAEAANGNPFRVMRLGNSLLVSKRSFDEWVEERL